MSLWLPFCYPLGYLHVAPLYVSTTESGHEHFYLTLSCSMINWKTPSIQGQCDRGGGGGLGGGGGGGGGRGGGAVKRSKVQGPTSNNVQLTPNYFTFGVQFRSFRTEKVPPIGYKDTPMGITSSVFPDSIKRIRKKSSEKSWKFYRIEVPII